MGTLCSVDKGAESDQHEKSSENSHPHNTIAIPRIQRILDQINGKKPTHPVSDHHPSPGNMAHKNYNFEFQHNCAKKSTNHDDDGKSKEKEEEASKTIERMRHEDDNVFTQDPPVSPGAHFLHVRDRLEDTRVFQLARLMPKAAHLHIHFNSMLLPGVLLGYAKDMVNMYIWSDRPLCTEDDFQKCNLEFSLRDLEERWYDLEKNATGVTSILSKLEDERPLTKAHKVHVYDEQGPNIFSSQYQAKTQMRYQYFRQLWEKKRSGSCDAWLTSKLTFSKEEVDSFFQEANDIDIEPAYDIGLEDPSGKDEEPETKIWWETARANIMDSKYRRNRGSARKAWTAFNARTKMMKGLFNYETAFRRYTRQCLEEFVKDNVQYAEIRPNFMGTNQIMNDEGKKTIDNFGTMELIIEEYENFMKDIGDMEPSGKIIDNPLHRPTFSGIKVIYCTPRSFKREAVAAALEECISMKKKWPDYIAGFDLVGEEAFSKPYPLKHFEKQFNDFRDKCNTEKLDIPFLFHCGETPDDLEGNLETALTLKSKRIGHGYALPTKTAVLEGMKQQNICVETCPISNMILGLAKNMDEHNLYALLEHQLPCAVSSDNGTLFKSTLSHDFYEVMAGHKNINLYGWKQLARWSIEHSCLSPDEERRMMAEWEKRWCDFIHVIYTSSGPGAQLANANQLKAVADKAEVTRLAKLGKRTVT